jgi:hypothetical protein
MDRKSTPQTPQALAAQAVLNGWITMKEISEAEQLRDRMRGRGAELTVLDALVRKGYLTRRQIEELSSGGKREDLEEDVPTREAVPVAPLPNRESERRPARPLAPAQPRADTRSRVRMTPQSPSPVSAAAPIRARRRARSASSDTVLILGGLLALLGAAVLAAYLLSRPKEKPRESAAEAPQPPSQAAPEPTPKKGPPVLLIAPQPPHLPPVVAPVPAPPAPPATGPKRSANQKAPDRWEYSFRDPEDLKDWLPIEPGWVCGEEGLTVAVKPVLNHRLEWSREIAGGVTVTYQGASRADVGLSFVDAANPARFDRVLAGGPTGREVGIQPAEKDERRVEERLVGDGRLHELKVVRDTARLALFVDGVEVAGLPNERTVNPSRARLRLHLYDQPGRFLNLTIQLTGPQGETSAPIMRKPAAVAPASVAPPPVPAIAPATVASSTEGKKAAGTGAPVSTVPDTAPPPTTVPMDLP